VPRRATRLEHDRGHPLLRDAHERHGSTYPGQYAVGHEESLVEDVLGAEPHASHVLGDAARAAEPAHLLIGPRRDQQGPPRREPFLEERLDRLEDCDERRLVVERSAAPHKAVGDRPRERRMGPRRLGPGSTGTTSWWARRRGGASARGGSQV
jgi:hypothetical protein